MQVMQRLFRNILENGYLFVLQALNSWKSGDIGGKHNESGDKRVVREMLFSGRVGAREL
jgi:hypothetical protein